MLSSDLKTELKIQSKKMEEQFERTKTLFDTSLKRYVEILEAASFGNLPANIDLDSLRHRPIRELIDEGLLSFYESTHGTGEPFKVLAATPKGAIALVDWKKILHEVSTIHKITVSLSRFLWVLVGVLCATLPKLYGV